MLCIVPGCKNDAVNNLGIRLRTRKKNAIWAQDTRAYVCDEHARQGMRISVLVEFTTARQVETHVCAEGGQDHMRITPINQAKLPPGDGGDQTAA